MFFAAQQDPPGPIERVVTPAPVAGLLGLDAPADRIEAAIGERDDVEGVDHLGRLGQHDAVDGGIGGRHVEGPETDPLLPGLGLFVDPARHIGVLAGGEDLDDLVVLDIGHRGGVVGVVPCEPSLTKEVSSRPMAVVRFKRLRSAAERASP